MPQTKRSPAKYQPKGVTILHEDKEIIVVEKPSGLLTIGAERDKSRTLHKTLNEYVRKGDLRSKNRIYIVHRLDRETSGILILAKSETAKNFLQRNWHETEKRYLAVVYGLLTPKTGTISSYLAENSAFTVYSTPYQELGKLSHTTYTVLKESNGLSLLEIHLLTGRKHQIRVHMSEKGHPIVGDRKYGKRNEVLATLALHAKSISFIHPVSSERLTFETGTPYFIDRLVGNIDGGELCNVS